MNILFYGPLAVVLLISVYTDLKHRLILDKVTLSGFIYFLTFYIIVDIGRLHWYFLGGLVLGGISLLMAVISKGQLGGGDIKLFALIGFVTGVEGGFVVLVFTYALAFLWTLVHLATSRLRKKTAMTAVPMAPFIAFGVLCYFIFY